MTPADPNDDSTILTCDFCGINNIAPRTSADILIIEYPASKATLCDLCAHSVTDGMRYDESIGAIDLQVVRVITRQNHRMLWLIEQAMPHAMSRRRALL